MIDFLNKNNFKYVEQYEAPNQYASDPILLPINKDGIKIFNEVYQNCLKSNMSILIRTKSGGISKCKENDYCWDCRHNDNGAVLTIYLWGRLYVFKIGHWGVVKKDIQPYKAFELFELECNKNGIYLDSYIKDNAKEIKAQIPKPYIVIFDEFLDKVLYNVHHLDFHSSYPAGLMFTHPEFEPVIRKFYSGRKEHPEYKAVLNYTIGMMQSTNVRTVNGKYSALSYDAITNNNERIDLISLRLRLNGNTIIGYNTDGIWYQGPIYKGPNEGKDIGQWSNDHKNCKFRAKSSGAYEFVENGKYYPVVRGTTTLDREKPRELWEWGDIYKSSVYVMNWDDKEGFTYEEL